MTRALSETALSRLMPFSEPRVPALRPVSVPARRKRGQIMHRAAMFNQTGYLFRRAPLRVVSIPGAGRQYGPS
jgi:hypothetical protein